MYQRIPNSDCIRRVSDGTVIPPGHRWWPEDESEIKDQVPTLADVRATLSAEATRLRWEHETSGITLSGVQVGTTTEDQNRISSVLAAASLGTFESVDFKADNGWVTLTLAEIQGIAAAISAHVQACFTAERAHHEAIEALDSLQAAEAYDVSTGWPA